VTKETYASKARTTPSKTPPQNRTENQDLHNIINLLKNIQSEIESIKNQVQDLNERVTWIESTYETETKEMMEELTSNKQDPTTNQIKPKTNNNENMQHKETQDIHSKQATLQGSIDRVEANMSAIINVLGSVTSSSLVNNNFPPNHQ
jgi:predicted  nucleic acid-binding Zn-ribbon protein